MEKLHKKQVITNRKAVMKEVPGFVRYMVSDTGDRVYDKIKKINLTMFQDERGYQFVHCIYDNDGVLHNSYPVHRLVALAWVPIYRDCNIVHHLDFNPSNNHKDNLIWVDNHIHLWIHQYWSKKVSGII